MSPHFYMGIDQGTTGSTCLVVDEAGSVRGSGYAEHTQHYPHPGWVEHDPREIWQKVQEAVSAALDDAGIAARQIRAIGLDNQGETCLAWDRRTGEPLANAIVWQDRRTAAEADSLRASHGALVQERTGLEVDAYFSALKLSWMLDHVPNLRGQVERGEAAFGTLDAWLLAKMTASTACLTDPSTASRTMLMNLRRLHWDEEILEILGLPSSALPTIVDTASDFGVTAAGSFLGAQIPITASVVDQMAALFGQSCFRPGDIKTTYGTGSFTLLNTGAQPVDVSSGLLATAAWRIGGQVAYALEGGVYTTGAAVQWLRDGLQIIESAAETAAAAESVPDTAGVFFVPAFVGLAAPHWDQYARGTIVGITGGTTRAHMIRATLEATAFQVAEVFEVMQQESELTIDTMRVDGGAVDNGFLMQFQADLLGIAVDVPEIHETTALGAAQLAAVGIGDIDELAELASRWRLSRRYEPHMAADQRADLRAQWARAVERARNWAE